MADIETLRPAIGRRRYGWGVAVAAAAAAAVLVVIGSIALIAPFSGEEPDAVTDPPTPPTVPVTSIPVTPTPSTVPVTSIPATPAPGLRGSGFINEVEDLALASDGTLWAATRAGVVRWDVAASIPVVYGEVDGLPAASVDEIVVAADGTVWAAGDRWVAFYDETWQPIDAEDIRSGKVIAGTMAADPTGGVRVATDDGLLQIERSGTELMVSYGPLGAYQPSDAAVDATGRVWISTIPAEIGLVLFDGSGWREFTTADGLPSHNLSNVAVAPDGTVWVATFGLDADVGGSPAAGVASFDGQVWTTYTTADGLASDEGAVVAAPDGTIWVVHGDAVSRREGATWTVHDVAGYVWGGDGAVGGADGTLWLGTDNGIVHFDGVTTTRYLVPTEMTPASGSFSMEPVAPAAPSVDAGSFGEVVWQTFEPPVGQVVYGGIATPHGFVAKGETSILTSSDGVTWAAVDTPREAWGFAVSGDDLYALGTGVTRLAWTGTSWNVVDELAIPDLGPWGVEQMVFGDGVTVLTVRTGVYFSTDGHTFTPAQRGPDPGILPGAGEPDPDVSGEPEDPVEESLAGGCRGMWLTGGFGEGNIGPVFATSTGFVAFTAGHPADWNNQPMCQPVLWTSDDGSTWDLVSTDSPFGSGSHVRDIAERDGLLVAVGGYGSSAMLWVSDDGLNWSQIPAERITGSMTGEVWAIGSGEAGWAALHGDAGLGNARMMYSLDGLNWVSVADVIPDFGWAYGVPDVTVGVDRILLPYISATIGEVTP